MLMVMSVRLWQRCYLLVIERLSACPDRALAEHKEVREEILREAFAALTGIESGEVVDGDDVDGVSAVTNAEHLYN